MDVALILVGVLLLAGANGANDVSKSIATLAGSGVTRYRSAVAWGAVTTLAGALASAWLGTEMLKLFSSGIVDAPLTPALAIAVLAGANAWVVAATALRLPVSTTHAIVGALAGAGLLLDVRAVRWSAVLTSVAVPLLISALVAFALSVALASAAHLVSLSARWRPPSVEPFYCGIAPLPAPRLSPAALTAAHWISAGAVGLARGLNDTPKIVAIGAFTLAPAGLSIDVITYLVAGGMCLAAVVAGIPVARRLGEDVVPLSHGDGLRANLTTSVLVTAGATAGLPMSTTHVSTGAIAGTTGRRLERLNTSTLRDFVLAWTLTPIVAAAIAAGVYLLLR